jgi:hypothetical protein
MSSGFFRKEGYSVHLKLMKYATIVSFLILANAGKISAQTENPQVRNVWANIVHDTANWPVIRDLCFDRFGNVYTRTWPNNNIEVLKKFNSQGTWKFSVFLTSWSDYWLSDLLSTDNHLAADANGNIYATGLEADWTYDPVLYANYLVRAYDSLGALRWDYRYEPSHMLWNSNYQDSKIATGPQGQVYIALGGGYPSEDCRDSGVFCPKDIRLFVRDSSGGGPTSFSFIGSNQLYSHLEGLIIDSSGNPLVYARTYNGSVARSKIVKFSPDGSRLGEVSVPRAIIDAALDLHNNVYAVSITGGYDGGLLTKFDSNLVFQWDVQLTGMIQPRQVLVDTGGYAVVMSNGTFSYVNPDSIPMGARKYRPDGSMAWSRTWSWIDFQPVVAAIDPAGNLYAADRDGTLSSYDPEGQERWIIPLSPNERMSIWPEAGGFLTLDKSGSIYFGGTLMTTNTLNCDNVGCVTGTITAKYVQQKSLVIRDAFKQPIPHSEFALIRVSNNPPLYSEDTLGLFQSDSTGSLVLPFVGTEGFLFPQTALNPVSDIIYTGDTIKIAKLTFTQSSARHQSVLGSQFTVHLDNGNFLAGDTLVFDTLTEGGPQDIVLRHTEYRYNLLASVEWDAEVSYLQGLMADFRQMSNYLYDVSDGQVRLDTVVILDDRSQWDEADVWIQASNIYWPNAGIMGIAWSGFPPIKLPRKWFGVPDSCRVFSYLLHPLMEGVSDNYRTMGHEFGHYGLGLSDEYVFVDGAGNLLPKTARCSSLPSGNYGFMDHHYDRPYYGVLASEMSSEYRYQDGSCRNTVQWYDNSRSCWDDFERWAQGPRNGIYVPILKPSVSDSTERITPPGLDYFPGPNDDLYNLNYDVGRLVKFPAAVLPPASGIQSVHLKVDTIAPGGLNVQLLRRGANPVYQTDQGSTTDNGQLWVYGMDFYQDEILVAGSSRTETAALKSANARAGVSKTWMCGSVRPGSGVSRTRSQSTASATGDSVTLSLRPVAGDYPMVCDGQLSVNGWTYGLWFDRALSQAPQLDIITDQGGLVTSIFTAGTNSYGSPVADYLTTPGKATIWAVDDSSHTFFFSTPFEVMDISSPTQLQKLIGPEGDAVVRIDSLNSGILRTMILSSDFPPLLNGLDPDAIQAGRTHSLSAYPVDQFTGANNISFKYSDDDLKSSSGAVMDDEATLRIFRWNPSGLQWELVGGFADTASNTVTAPIDQSGVYGAFTTIGDCCSGRVGDVNGIGGDEPSIGDVSLMIDAKFISLSCERIPCIAEADVNQSGGSKPTCDNISIGDISVLIDYLFITGPSRGLPECM